MYQTDMPKGCWNAWIYILALDRLSPFTFSTILILLSFCHLIAIWGFRMHVTYSPEILQKPSKPRGVLRSTFTGIWVSDSASLFHHIFFGAIRQEQYTSAFVLDVHVWHPHFVQHSDFPGHEAFAWKVDQALGWSLNLLRIIQWPQREPRGTQHSCNTLHEYCIEYWQPQSCSKLLY